MKSRVILQVILYLAIVSHLQLNLMVGGGRGGLFDAYDVIHIDLQLHF